MDILHAGDRETICGSGFGVEMGRVRMPPRSASGVRPADAVQIYLGTLTVPDTRVTYAAALNRLVADFGSDTDVSLLGAEPDRVSGWFTFVWGGKSAKRFNIRLTALISARAEEVLMKLSGHTSVCSLAKYAQVSDEGLRRYQAGSDPAARRR